MAKYILKQEAIFALTNEAKTHNNPVKRAYTRAAAIIEQITAEDVQPVKHGRWLSHHAIWIDQPKIKGWFVQAKCSECEKWAHVMDPYTKSVDYECCPHCGAKMIKDGDTE